MKKENIVTYIYYIGIAVVSLCAFYWLSPFYWLSHLNGNLIKWLLEFYKNVVEIFFSNYHYFNESEGYYVGSNYIIGENCLGLNIIVLIFGFTSLLNVGKLRGCMRILWIAGSALMAVVLGVFSNILRLLSSIYFTTFASFELIHALLGIVIYLSALIFCYVFSAKIVRNFAGDKSSVTQTEYPYERGEDNEESL